MAFEWAFNIGGGVPLKKPFVVKDTVVLSEGEFVNLESGEVDSGATNDTGFVGIAISAVDNTSDGESVWCIVNRDAVYAVDDANVRTVGDTLDLASGALGVTTSSNADFIVIQDSTASEKTLVYVTVGNHWLD
jgi:hypothetical protein